MEISEFIEATNRLERYFDKEYTKDQMQEAYKELKEFEIERYQFLISQAIRECKFLPKVADFFRINSENPHVTVKEKKEKVYCKKCNSTGYVIYKKKIDNGSQVFYNQYAAVCECGNSSIYKGLDIKDKEHRTDFYTPTVQELGLAQKGF